MEEKAPAAFRRKLLSVPRPPSLFSPFAVALHGFIKKTRTTPDEGLALARKRQTELER
jgi:hypothetical protein